MLALHAVVNLIAHRSIESFAVVETRELVARPGGGLLPRLDFGTFVVNKIVVALVSPVTIKELGHRHLVDELLPVEEEFLLPCHRIFPRGFPARILEPSGEEAAQKFQLARRHLEETVRLKIRIDADVLHVEAQDARTRRMLHMREQVKHLAVAHLPHRSAARVFRHQLHHAVHDALVGQFQLHRGGKHMENLFIGHFILFHVLL